MTLALFALFAVEVYVVSSAWVVTGGYGYGARRLSDCAVLIALGIGLLWAHFSEPVKQLAWRRLIVGFCALCIVLNVWAMELLRAHRIASSGAYARSARRFLEDAGAPTLLARFFGAVGYPFVQPAGWLFALAHHAPLASFDGVAGNFFLDRDGQWMQIQTRTLTLERDARAYVVEGLDLSKKPARVTGPMRMLLPMFATETVGVHVFGLIAPGVRSATWNGVSVPTRDDQAGVRLEAPATAVHPGVNELRLTLPTGSELSKIEFDSTTEWWRKK